MKGNVNGIALGGVLLALSAITLFLASFVPGVELSLYALSSLYPAAMVIEKGPKGGWMFYAASVLLAFVLVPNKGAVLIYGAFFGLYPLAKYYIEKIGKQVPEIILKLVFFNITWGACLLLLRSLFLGAAQFPAWPLPLLAVAAQVVMLLYDYVFTLLIGFYRQRIKNKG